MSWVANQVWLDLGIDYVGYIFNISDEFDTFRMLRFAPFDKNIWCLFFSWFTLLLSIDSLIAKIIGRLNAKTCIFYGLL